MLFTIYIQGVLKLKKNNSGAKGLNMNWYYKYDYYYYYYYYKIMLICIVVRQWPSRWDLWVVPILQTITQTLFGKEFTFVRISTLSYTRNLIFISKYAQLRNMLILYAFLKFILVYFVIFTFVNLKSEISYFVFTRYWSM